MNPKNWKPRLGERRKKDVPGLWPDQTPRVEGERRKGKQDVRSVLSDREEEMKPETPKQEQCSYCKESYPYPVSLHHDENQCLLNAALTECHAWKDRAEKAEQALALRGEPAAWRWRWLAGDEPDIWTYTESKPLYTSKQHIEPLYTTPSALEEEFDDLCKKLARTVNDLAVEKARNAAPISGERAAEELDGTCARCGEIYDLPAGSDPTKYCHDCAHERVAELENAVSGERVREALENAKAYIQLNETGVCVHDGGVLAAIDLALKDIQ